MKTRVKTIEKAATVITLLLFLAAAGLTVSAESQRMQSPVEITEISPSPQTSSPKEGLININTADIDELCELNGIGPVLAQRIIDYREKYGAFSSTADIFDVSGIGHATFEKIKDKITV